MKGFKVTDNERKKRFGIAANSLEMLKEKAKVKFCISDCRVYLSKDGFEVSDEDYFRTITPQTLFIVAEPNDVIMSDSEYELNKLKERSSLLQVSDIVSEFIENNPEKFKQILIKYGNLINNDSTNIKTYLSHKNDHIEWFEGQDVHYQTKEEVLAKKAQDRFRGYFYKTKDEIIKHELYKTNRKAKEILDKILEKFHYLLIGCNYFSALFDRSFKRKHTYLNDQIDTSSKCIHLTKKFRQIIKEYTTRKEYLNQWIVSLCTNEGDFYCQGTFSKNDCINKHTINPYSTRENLILFQIWNLDHQIEMTRTIIPSIIQNVQNLSNNPKQKCKNHNKQIIDLSIIEYFLELFSCKNLKLVHIVCHEKVQRTNKSNGTLICELCDEYKFIKDLDYISCSENIVDS